MKTLSVIVVVAFGLAVVPLQSQVPIDLSQAREFRVIWKKLIGGDVGRPKYIPAPCAAEGRDILSIGSSIGGFGCFTNPRIDTSQPVLGWSSVHILFDYDGIAPLEYMNDNGRIDGCRSSEYPFQLQRGLDTVECWGPGVNGINAEYTEDIDGDGYRDLICDIGGGGYTARVIRGGPQAGRGCQRILQIPKVMGADQFNTTKAFWRSSSGTWRMLQDEKDAMALSPWLMLYEMRLEHLSEGTRITWVKTDSMYGNGNHINDIPVGDAAVVTDTTTGRDWLMIMRRLNNGPRTWVLERFDATDGRFTPTGEQVTGVEFYAPWNAGYSLGTSRPVIMLGEGSFCYADNLRQPFARVRFKNSGLQPVSGFVAINDQTGDGKPDLIASGGTTDGAVALYTLDSLTSTIGEQNSAKTLPIVELIQQTLITTVDRPMTASVSLATTDGRHFPIVTPWQTSTGTQRVDLGQYLGDLPRGVYFVRVTLDATVHTLQFVRP
jgi:hypothetical protein